MQTSIPLTEIQNQLYKQLQSFFILSKQDKDCIDLLFHRAIDKIEYCFSKTPNKYYSLNGETFFNPYQSAQYCIFLYYLSNIIFKNGNSLLADKVYYLNKIMNACDMFYEVELPDFFMLYHPVGSVMGRAKYSYGFSFSQNCTVGQNHDIYPTIGENVKMCANSSIIGKCTIGGGQ